jgi:hypothetical protein
MRLVEVTYRHRNDFHWVGECEHCGTRTRYGDGYADTYYCTVVVPHRYCTECHKNSYGKTAIDEVNVEGV